MDDLFSNLPEDTELAFVQLVEEFEAELNRNLSRADERSDTTAYLIDYMNNVIAASIALEILEFDNDQPYMKDGNIWEDYQEFSLRVKRFVLTTKIRNSRVGKTYSVALDDTAKRKIRHYITQIKELLDSEEFDARKKDVLRAKLVDFDKEVERDRTRFDRVMANSLAIIGLMEKGAATLDHVTNLINSITRVMAEAKSIEPLPDRLPPPPQRKQIPPPKPRQDLDGDIPF